MKSAPLLKFKNDEAYLAQEGVDVIKGITGTVCPLILIGDGRAGKSYLASRILDTEDAFTSSDSAEPVTEGIDIIAVPVAKLLASTGLPGDENAPPDEHLLVLDCEGGNNAMAAIRTLVNVFGIVVGTQVLFVANGMATEQALQNLGASIAASSLIKLDGSGDGGLPEQRLVFVVNKNTLKYEGSALEKILNQEHPDAGRQELRESVKGHFPQRDFFAVPMQGMSNFEEVIQDLRGEVLRNRRPLTISDEAITGPKLSGLLDLVVKEIQKSNEVSFPSMSRFVIYDSFLVPLVKRIAEDAKLQLPALEDFDPDIARLAPHESALGRFEKESSHIKQREFVEEARQSLQQELLDIWLAVERANELFGEQVKEIKTEFREVCKETLRAAIGGRGLLKRVIVTKKTMEVETRGLAFKKKGGEPECSEWKGNGATVERFEETCLEPLKDGALPKLKGCLKKKSPNFVRALFSGRQQERVFLLCDGHLMWWDKAEADNRRAEAKGCISFLVHRAEVAACSDPAAFAIRPQLGKQWTETEEKTFTGKGDREFLFDTEGCNISRDEWVEALEKHIAFGNAIFEELGEERAKSLVQNCKPTLIQVET